MCFFFDRVKQVYKCKQHRIMVRGSGLLRPVEGRIWWKQDYRSLVYMDTSHCTAVSPFSCPSETQFTFWDSKCWMQQQRIQLVMNIQNVYDERKVYETKCIAVLLWKHLLNHYEFDIYEIQHIFLKYQNQMIARAQHVPTHPKKHKQRKNDPMTTKDQCPVEPLKSPF